MSDLVKTLFSILLFLFSTQSLAMHVCCGGSDALHVTHSQQILSDDTSTVATKQHCGLHAFGIVTPATLPVSTQRTDTQNQTLLSAPFTGPHLAWTKTVSSFSAIPVIPIDLSLYRITQRIRE